MPQGTKLALVLLIAGHGTFAQSRNDRPVSDEFEVATIKPTAADWDAGRYMRMQTTVQFVAKNFPLRLLLAAAFNLAPREISGGPSWIDSERYDIVGKAPGEARPDQGEQMSMLRSLLLDRFKIAFHREQKELSIYALEVAKNGPKMKESSESPGPSPKAPPPLAFVLFPQGARLPARNTTMAELAGVLQRAAVDRPVVDRTGLSGKYDFDLEWRPDETQFNGQFRDSGPGARTTKPDLFAAIQEQLGLRLEATKGPVDTLVIDQAERPSAN